MIRKMENKLNQKIQIIPRIMISTKQSNSMRKKYLPKMNRFVIMKVMKLIKCITEYPNQSYFLNLQLKEIY